MLWTKVRTVSEPDILNTAGFVQGLKAVETVPKIAHYLAGLWHGENKVSASNCFAGSRMLVFVLTIFCWFVIFCPC
jgi:hypothetical protein